MPPGTISNPLIVTKDHGSISKSGYSGVCVVSFNNVPPGAGMLRPPNKKLFPVHQPGGLKRADSDFFFMIFESSWYILLNEKLKTEKNAPGYWETKVVQHCYFLRVKPIFHCNAKPFALILCFGLPSQFHVGDTNLLVSKNAKICILPLTPSPNASRWNIGGVGSPTQSSHVGHVDFMLFVSLSLALGSQRERNFQWNMGFRI